VTKDRELNERSVPFREMGRDDVSKAPLAHAQQRKVESESSTFRVPLNGSCTGT